MLFLETKPSKMAWSSKIPYENCCYKSDSHDINSAGIIQCHENTDTPCSWCLNNFLHGYSHRWTSLHPINLFQYPVCGVAWLHHRLRAHLLFCFQASPEKWGDWAVIEEKDFRAISAVQSWSEKAQILLNAQKVSSWIEEFKKGISKILVECEKSTLDVIWLMRHTKMTHSPSSIIKLIGACNKVRGMLTINLHMFLRLAPFLHVSIISFTSLFRLLEMPIHSEKDMLKFFQMEFSCEDVSWEQHNH